jgi:Ser/Thr protein kinase RdoA (MazF antagonist)
LTTIQRSWDAGQLPTRTTHNDTKFNNVLFGSDGIGRAVVDLDTVMQGVVHFDFGDGVRTGAATAPEDEADLHLVGVDPAKYQAFQEGYLEITQDYLTPLELELLPLAGPLLAYLMAVRFLTDFLNGDVYYKTAYPDHNLVRGRNQLKLVEELLKLT